MYINSKMRQWASAVFVYSGFSRYARRLHRDSPCILMFHGVRESGDPGLLDPGLHIDQTLFANVCEHLARHFKVVSLSSILKMVQSGEPMPSGTVALTFDDGYASNHHLAFPVLKRLGLPATIFPATGFLDKTELPWFLRVEYAVAKTKKRNVVLDLAGSAYGSTLETPEQRLAFVLRLHKALKGVSQEHVVPLTALIEKELGCAMQHANDWPDIFAALTWDEAREMHASGLVEFGGHTHRHLILSRCQPPLARREITECRDRLTAELGVAPTTFAYPNGQRGDHNSGIAELLREEGFNLAVTTECGFVRHKTDAYELPRHGAPISGYHAEATVSGAFETFKQWRQSVVRIPRKAWS